MFLKIVSPYPPQFEKFASRTMGSKMTAAIFFKSSVSTLLDLEIDGNPRAMPRKKGSLSQNVWEPV